jgi:hypothetical protein
VGTGFSKTVLGVVVHNPAYEEVDDVPESKKHLRIFECDLCYELFEFDVLTINNYKQTLASHNNTCSVWLAAGRLEHWETRESQEYAAFPPRGRAISGTDAAIESKPSKDEDHSGDALIYDLGAYIGGEM